MTAASFVLCVLVAYAAVDVSGTWTLEYRPDFSGNAAKHDCVFTQHAQALTIVCGEQTINGEVSGQTVKFQHPAGKAQESLATYEGTLDEGGTTMVGTWRLTPGDRQGKFEARKQQEP
jgi:hypothetical protein